MAPIKQNIPLAPLTTFDIGGNARFFVEVSTVYELAEAIKFANDKKLAVFVLGGGSNILISDEGFNGLVVKMDISGITLMNTPIPGSRAKHTMGHSGWRIRAGAGEIWDDIVAKAVELNVSGIENLSLIPGTVGGAVYQNIGAYGAELKDVLISMQAYDIKTGSIVELSNKECGFEYRSSIFKKNKDLIILEAELLLSEDNKPNLLYPDLKNRFKGQNPSVAQIRDAVIEIRMSKIPYPNEVRNTGSFFKNPTVKNSNYKFLISKYPDLKGYNTDNGLVKLSAAQLIERAGFKGRRVGNVGVSAKHALVLVNYGSGTAKELNDLVERVKEAVEAKFSVKLEAEVENI